MRYFLIIIVVFIASCSTKVRSSATASYYVYKIDSIKSYYLIYAKKSDSIYKIVSKKESLDQCLEIKEKQYYNFKLKSILKNRFENTSFPKTMNDADITCFAFDDDIQICKEKGIYDLHLADNVKGLCFTRK